MKILLIHTRYRQPGGEDAVFDQETALLARRHTVETLLFHNDDLKGGLQGLLNTYSHRESYQRTRQVLDSFRPDVVHIHNIYYQASWAVAQAAHEAGYPVLMTLHNYRMLCANGLFLRQSRACEDCLGHRWGGPGIRRGCFQGSVLKTAVLSLSQGLHRSQGHWSQWVDRYLVLSPFMKAKVREGLPEIPEEKVHIKPNSTEDMAGSQTAERGRHLLFVGRLAAEKGLDTLLEAAKMTGLPLRIAGGGPLQAQVEQLAKHYPHAQYLGRLNQEELKREMAQARGLVFPSVFYEGLPMTLLEAYSARLPILFSRQHNIKDLVEEGGQGLGFVPGDAADLARAWQAFDQTDQADWQAWSARCRQRYETEFTHEHNLAALEYHYTQLLRP